MSATDTADALKQAAREGREQLHQQQQAKTAVAVDLRFLTVAELRRQTPARPPWLWEDYIAAGALTLLAGKPKAGKSTLAFAISTAMGSDAATLLGRAIVRAPVVYVSEEAGPTLLHKLPGDDASLHLLTRDGAWPKPEWPQLVGAAVTHARKVCARLLVIDTAAYWTALPADREKDAGAVQAVMLPLLQATRSGLAVLLVHHARKAGGEDGDAVRGSSGWAGSVDTILELERAPENAPSTQRLLLGLGRYPSTPACALIDHDTNTGTWTVSGHADDRRSARTAATRTLLLDALKAGDSLTRPDIEEITGTAWRELLDTMNTLVADKCVKRTGAGRKGDPYRYAKAVGNAPPQNPTVPTASPGGDAALSVVCHVVTPQKAAPPSATNAVAVEAHSNGEAIANADEEATYRRALSLIEEGKAA